MPSISATARIAGSVTQPSCSCARQRSEITAEACRPGGYFAISRFAHARLAAVKAKVAGWLLGEAADGHQRSTSPKTTSPKTMSSEPRMAVTSASMWPRVMKSMACGMGEARRLDLAAVGLVGAVGDQIDAELALRRLDRRVNLAGRHVIALGVELEVMDERLHRALHLAALRRHDLAVIGRDRAPCRSALVQLVDALLHDADRLAHLLHADEVAVVAVAVLADRNVEIHLGVALVGLRLAEVPGGAGAAHHHAGKAPLPGVVEADDADIDVALLEDAVAGEQPVDVVDDLQERVAERADVVDELLRQVLVHAARPEIGRMHAAARRRARRRPSASRAPRSPRAAASARRRPAPAW